MQAPVTDVSTLTELWRNVAPLAFIATCGFLWKVNSRLIRIETILTGATGENGLVGNAADLEKRVRTLETQ